MRINNGFWDLSPEERGSAMDRACEEGGVVDFWDLPAEERGRAYDRAAGQGDDDGDEWP